MRIGVPSQHTANEARVAITPDVAKRLVAASHAVVVESGAGTGAGTASCRRTGENTTTHIRHDHRGSG